MINLLARTSDSGSTMGIGLLFWIILIVTGILIGAGFPGRQRDV